MTMMTHHRCQQQHSPTQNLLTKQQRKEKNIRNKRKLKRKTNVAVVAVASFVALSLPLFSGRRIPFAAATSSSLTSTSVSQPQQRPSSSVSDQGLNETPTTTTLIQNHAKLKSNNTSNLRNLFLIPPQIRLSNFIISKDSLHVRIGGAPPLDSDDDVPRGGGGRGILKRKFTLPKIEFTIDNPFTSSSSFVETCTSSSSSSSSLKQRFKTKTQSIKPKGTKEQEQLLKKYPLTNNEYISYYPPIQLPPPLPPPSTLTSSTKTRRKYNDYGVPSSPPTLHSSPNHDMYNPTTTTNPALKQIMPSSPQVIQEYYSDAAPYFPTETNSCGSGISVSLANPSSASNVVVSVGKGVVRDFLGGAVLGTLTLLGPLIASRKILHHTGLALSETLFKQYLRRKYTRLERVYLRYYEAPATFRASCRVISQVGLLWSLNELFDVFGLLWNQFVSFIGVADAGGVGGGNIGGAAATNKVGLGITQLYQVTLMVTIGRIFAELLSSWGGPLRIQATSQPKRSSPKAFHDKPVHAWNWTMEGGAIWWYKYASSPESSRYFDPNPLAFPITWFPPTLMLLCGVARALSAGSMISMATSAAASDTIAAATATTMTKSKILMRRFIVQLALGDEWQRVFLGERRVGLGIFVAFTYLIALLGTIKTTIALDRVSAMLMAPSFLCVCVSGWMNVVIFWNRMDAKTRKKVISILRPYQK
mmetsp:Transcript_37426/g.56015  ORF Transcript_37426/g.56015 Transcript_37426/m.56015 type:complete len:702 (-) Transcript_37426:920-3025(-)